MNQRLERLDLLVPMLREPARAFIAAAKKDLGHELCVTHTWRAALDQLQLYSQGRQYSRAEGIWTVSNQALVVTNAPPGSSAHNVVQETTQAPASMAMDLIPFRADGTLAWDTPISAWGMLWELSWKFGFDPLGDKVGAYLRGDQGHFQEPGWKGKLSGVSCILPPVNLAAII